MLKRSGVLKKERINKITKLLKRNYTYMHLVELETVLKNTYKIYVGF